MDPNAALIRIRKIRARMENDETARSLDAFAELEELNELVTALDEWLSNGGFVPSAWTH